MTLILSITISKKHIKENKEAIIKNLSKYRGQIIERYLCEALKKEGFDIIKHTSDTRDRGADIVAKKGRNVYVMEVKFNSSSSISLKKAEEILKKLKYFVKTDSILKDRKKGY